MARPKDGKDYVVEEAEVEASISRKPHLIHRSTNRTFFSCFCCYVADTTAKRMKSHLLTAINFSTVEKREKKGLCVDDLLRCDASLLCRGGGEGIS